MIDHILLIAEAPRSRIPGGIRDQLVTTVNSERRTKAMIVSNELRKHLNIHF